MPKGEPDRGSPDQGGRIIACRSNGKADSLRFGIVCFKSELQKTKAALGCGVWHTRCCQGSPDIV